MRRERPCWEDPASCSGLFRRRGFCKAQGTANRALLQGGVRGVDLRITAHNSVAGQDWSKGCQNSELLGLALTQASKLGGILNNMLPLCKPKEMREDRHHAPAVEKAGDPASVAARSSEMQGSSAALRETMARASLFSAGKATVVRPLCTVSSYSAKDARGEHVLVVRARQRLRG